MADGFFNAGSVFVPLIFGLVPAFLPMRSSFLLRALLWLGALALSIWYGVAMDSAPPTYRHIAWATITVSAVLSFIVLVTNTGRPRHAR